MTIFLSFNLLSAEWIYDEEKQLLTDGTWGFVAEISETNKTDNVINLCITAHAESYSNHNNNCELDLRSCSNITSYSGLKYSLTEIQSIPEGFFNISSLVTRILLPSSLGDTNIVFSSSKCGLPSYFIIGCTNIVEIDMTDLNFITIPSYFCMLSSIKSIILKPNTVYQIQSLAFYDNVYITNKFSDVISPSLSYLGGSAFGGSSFSGDVILTNLNNESLNNAFNGTAINSLTLNSVKLRNIKSLFYGTTSTNTIIVKLNTPNITNLGYKAFYRGGGGKKVSIYKSEDTFKASQYADDYALCDTTLYGDLIITNYTGTSIGDFGLGCIITSTSTNKYQFYLNCPNVKTFACSCIPTYNLKTAYINAPSIETLNKNASLSLGLYEGFIGIENLKHIMSYGISTSWGCFFNELNFNNIQNINTYGVNNVMCKKIRFGDNLKTLELNSFSAVVDSDYNYAYTEIEFADNINFNNLIQKNNYNVFDIRPLYNDVVYGFTSLVFKCSAPTNEFDTIGKTNVLTSSKKFIDHMISLGYSSKPRPIIYCDRKKGWRKYARQYDAEIDGTNKPPFGCFGVYDTFDKSQKAWLVQYPLECIIIVR